MPQTALGNRGINYEHDLLSNAWKNGYDANWINLDTVSTFYVLDLLTAEPGSPTVGSAYLLGATQTGANWGSDGGADENSIAIFANIPGLPDSSPWLYLAPRDGWRMFNRATSLRSSLTYDFAASRWISRAENEQGATVVDDNGGDYTPTLAQENGAIILSSAFDQAGDDFVIPQESAVPYKIGTTIEVSNKSAGSVAVGSTGITFVGGSLASLPIGRTRLIKTASDTWAAIT